MNHNPKIFSNQDFVSRPSHDSDLVHDVQSTFGSFELWKRSAWLMEGKQINKIWSGANLNAALVNWVKTPIRQPNWLRLASTGHISGIWQDWIGVPKNLRIALLSPEILALGWCTQKSLKSEKGRVTAQQFWEGVPLLPVQLITCTCHICRMGATIASRLPVLWAV